MHRIVDRLERKLTWHLLAPDAARRPALIPTAPDRRYADLLADVQATRAAVFGLDDAVPHEDLGSTDRAAWHFVATDPRGRVAGAMRLFVVDTRLERLSAADVIGFGHVEFPCRATEAQHVRALTRFLQDKASEPYYLYAGGFFATEAWRGSGLAAVLGMAAIALARLHRSRCAASFASARDRAPELFRLLGGMPMALDGDAVLAPFRCARHGFDIQLLAFDSLAPDPQVEQGVRLLESRLSASRAMTRAASGECTARAEAFASADFQND